MGELMKRKEEENNDVFMAGCGCCAPITRTRPVNARAMKLLQMQRSNQLSNAQTAFAHPMTPQLSRQIPQQNLRTSHQIYEVQQLLGRAYFMRVRRAGGSHNNGASHAAAGSRGALRVQHDAGGGLAPV